MQYGIQKGKREIWTILGKFGQVWASLGKLGQVRTRQQIRKIGGKGRKNKKREQKFEWGEEEGEGGESKV